MNQKLPFIGQLKPQYFWDVEISRLDDAKNKRLIIERIVTLGSLEEIKAIIAHYGRSEVVQVVQKLILDPKTLNFLSKYFDIPKTSFQCYTTKRSTPGTGTCKVFAGKRLPEWFLPCWWHCPFLVYGTPQIG